MRIHPFYSPYRGIGLEDAWHNDSECPIGKSIAPRDRFAGKGPIDKRCRYCELLDRPTQREKGHPLPDI